MTLTLTILGSGSSAGVPRPALGWGAADPSNPKNRRLRCSLLAERITPEGGITRVLIDTSPDLREQLISADVDDLDAVFLTHEHADQTHGIDDLRSVAMHMRKRIPVYLNQSTADHVVFRFHYCFATPPGSSYPPILDEHRIEAGETRNIAGAGGDITLAPFLVQHGDIPALGYRIGGAAYTPDVHDIPEQSFSALEGLDLWIIDGLRYKYHASHFNIETALKWIARFQPKRAVITNMHADLDYETLRKELPESVVPGFDGMRLDIAG
ncbi:MAG: MBL fold metallo-hydrolase [Pseudomonadota bacterium]